MRSLLVLAVPTSQPSPDCDRQEQLHRSRSGPGQPGVDWHSAAGPPAGDGCQPVQLLADPFPVISILYGKSEVLLPVDQVLEQDRTLGLVYFGLPEFALDGVLHEGIRRLWVHSLADPRLARLCRPGVSALLCVQVLRELNVHDTHLNIIDTVYLPDAQGHVLADLLDPECEFYLGVGQGCVWHQLCCV